MDEKTKQVLREVFNQNIRPEDDITFEEFCFEFEIEMENERIAA